MKLTRIISILSLPLLVSILLGMASGGADSLPKHVSLIQLLATPAEYDHKRVVVEGFFHHGLENSGLYLNPDHAKYAIRWSSVWIGTSAHPGDNTGIDQTNDVYVRVRGVFYNTRSGGGHMGLWPSELNEIDLLVTLPAASPGN